MSEFVYLEIIIEDVINFVFKRKNIIIDENKEMICENCSIYKNDNFFPIPIKKYKDTIYCEKWICSYLCFKKFIEKKQNDGDMKYLHSLNIMYVCLPFLLTNTYEPDNI
uniref:Uncharacterized protein n=1 Tax=viral metagenome TaxID=1070528 RepID=A0A6C0JQ24_9ZZZZ